MERDAYSNVLVAHEKFFSLMALNSNYRASGNLENT